MEGAVTEPPLHSMRGVSGLVVDRDASEGRRTGVGIAQLITDVQHMHMRMATGSDLDQVVHHPRRGVEAGAFMGSFRSRGRASQLIFRGYESHCATIRITASGR